MGFTALTKELSRKGLYEFLGKEFAAIKPGSHVLNVGSGGDIESLLRAQGDKNKLTLTSFDIDPKRNPDRCGDICTYQFPPEEKYDAVILSEVLEHTHAPHLCIENIYNLLTPGGKLILSTPFIFPIHEAPHDYFRFTKYGLAHLLKKFADVTILERNSYFEAINVLKVRLSQGVAKGPRILLKTMAVFTYFIGQPIAKFLSALFPSDKATTGYHVTATKNQ